MVFILCSLGTLPSDPLAGRSRTKHSSVRTLRDYYRLSQASLTYGLRCRLPFVQLDIDTDSAGVYSLDLTVD